MHTQRRQLRRFLYLPICLLIALWLGACQPTFLSPPTTPATPPRAVPTNTSFPPTEAQPADNELALFERAMAPFARKDVAWVAETLHPTFYQIEASFDPESHTVAGSEQVRYTNNEDVPLDAVYFRLFPNLPNSGKAMASDLAVNGTPVTPREELQGSALRVPLSPPLQPGTTITVSLSFTVEVPTEIRGNYGTLAYVNDVLALAGFYPLIPVYDDEGWNVEIAPNYGDVVYSDTSFYLVRFTLPTGWDVAASGSTLKVEEHEDGTTTWTLITGPMRDFNLVASPRYVVSETYVGDTLVRSHYKPEDRAGGQRALDYTVRALRYFNETFGLYPFAELDIAATSTTAGGVEYPGLIVLAQRLYTQLDSFFEWATVHETAHQWWYSLVGNDQVDEPWLDEALAQYATLMYIEATYGDAVARTTRWLVFERPYNRVVAAGQDQPVDQPVRAFTPELYGAIVYSKGPLFFQALREKMGDEAFIAFLRAYYETYRYRIATPEGLLALAGQACACDVQPIYRQWILGVATLTSNDQPSASLPPRPQLPHQARPMTPASP